MIMMMRTLISTAWLAARMLVKVFGSVFGGSVLPGGASGLHCYPEP